MHLQCDDKNKIYVWVDDLNPCIKLSPHFDYEEDAIQWYLNQKPQQDDTPQV